MEDTFGNHGAAIVDAHDFALDDAADDEIDNLVDGDLGLVEEFGNDDHGVMASASDAECQVAGGTSHGGDDEPVLRSACILHHGGADDGALSLGAVVAEGGGAVGERQVVVDGFGHVDVGNGVVFALQELCNAVGGGGGVVATHGHQQFHLVVGEERQVETFLEVLVSGFESAHLQDTATLIENLVSCKEVEILHAGFVGEEGAVAAMKAYHAVAVSEEGFGHGGHHGVHSGGRTATREDCYTFHLFLVFIVGWIIISSVRRRSLQSRCGRRHRGRRRGKRLPHLP